jgi:hypothetical protein
MTKDIPILACRPADPSDWPLWLPPLPPWPYPERLTLTLNCVTCNLLVRVSPKAQKVIRANPGIPVFCSVCARAVLNASAEEPVIINLGGPGYGPGV